MESFIQKPSEQVRQQPRYGIKWHDLFLAVSFSVAVGVMSSTYENVGQDVPVLVPTNFISRPTLFHVFVILNAFTFTASAIGTLLYGMHRRIDRYLFLFALSMFSVATVIYTSVAIPRYASIVLDTLSSSDRYVGN